MTSCADVPLKTAHLLTLEIVQSFLVFFISYMAVFVPFLSFQFCLKRLQFFSCHALVMIRHVAAR